MEYLRIDPRLDEHPDVLEAGFAASTVFQAILRAVGSFDKQGHLPKKFGAKWLVRRLNMGPEDVGQDPETRVAAGIHKCLCVGLLERDGEDIIVPGWERFYTPSVPGVDRTRSYRERLKARSGQTDSEIVYFIENPATKLIKIGRTTNLGQRQMDIQREAGAAFPLRVLATMPGGLELESEMHRRFAKHRKGGEWFEDVPAIRALTGGAASPETSQRHSDATPLHTTPPTPQDSTPQPPTTTRDDEDEVLKHYAEAMEANDIPAFPTEADRLLVRERLADGIGKHELTVAIDGLTWSDWHMGRNPKSNGKSWTGLKYALGNKEKVQKFIDEVPPHRRRSREPAEEVPHG